MAISICTTIHFSQLSTGRRRSTGQSTPSRPSLRSAIKNQYVRYLLMSDEEGRKGTALRGSQEKDVLRQLHRENSHSLLYAEAGLLLDRFRVEEGRDKVREEHAGRDRWQNLYSDKREEDLLLQVQDFGGVGRNDTVCHRQRLLLIGHSFI